MNKQKMNTYKHIDNCLKQHCKHCQKCDAKYEKLGYHYCKKCHALISKALRKDDEVYINKEIGGWIDKLTDLFCLENKPIVQIRASKRQDRHGQCWYTTPCIIDIWTNHEHGKISLKTLVHEFLHATGYKHEYEINDWANFGYGKGSDRDKFSKLVTRDLCGKDDLLL